MEVHLYCYENIKNVPVGVIIKNGRDILPEEDIFAYQERQKKIITDTEDEIKEFISLFKSYIKKQAEEDE